MADQPDQPEDVTGAPGEADPDPAPGSERRPRPTERAAARLARRNPLAEDVPPPLTPEARAAIRAEMSDVPGWLSLSASWSWRLIVTVLALFGFLWILAQLFLVVMPIIVAVVLATILIPPAEYLERRGIPPAAAGLIVVGGSLLLVFGVLAALAPSFIDQLRDLSPKLAEGRDAVLDWAETGPLGISSNRIDDLLEQTRAAVGSNSQGVVGGIVTGATFVGQFAAGFVLMLVLLFFFVKDRDQITGWARNRIAPQNREVAAALGSRAWAALGGYVRGTATIALIDAVGIGIGLAVIGVPLAMPLTFLVFLGGFLPVVGAFTAGLVAVLVALAESVPTALAALVLILAVQQLEGNILQPVIMRRAVALHPTVILIALTAGAAIAGIVGAFLAVPLAAVLAAVGNELRIRGEHNGDAEAAGTAPA